ncbi:MAG: hypothetical protein PHW82_15195 [Bacteroidales bacterium]|nr:hypothetical protein [Bacteroidales bacterium]
MKSKDFILIERLDQLIRLKATGNPANLAKKLNVTERQVYNIINKLKTTYKAPVIFDKDRNSYVYNESGRIIMGFYKDALSPDVIKQISGGKKCLLKFSFQ